MKYKLPPRPVIHAALALALATAAGCGAQQKTSVNRVGLKPVDVRDSSFGAGASGSTPGGTGPAPGSQNAPGNGDGSHVDPLANDTVSVFARTVYPLATKWCATCHATVQTPYFAQADTQKSHDAVLTSQKVDFTNPEKSRLYERLATDKHNCPDMGCDAAAAQMLDAIKAWGTAIAGTAVNTPQLPNTATFKLADAAAKTVPGSNPPGVLMFEAEAFTLKAPMVKTALTTASGGFTIDVPANATAVTTVKAATGNAALGSITMTFNVTTAGTYTVQGLVNGATATNAEFFINMDAGALTPWIFPPTAAAFAWAPAAATAGGTPTPFTLTAGSHTLVITQSRPGARIDKVVLSSVAGFDPGSAQPATRDVKLLTFDLSGIVHVAGAALTVEISDFSANAYMFKNPTLVVPTGSLHVKDMRLLVNGDFLAQNATYTTVDKILAAPGGLLSTAALVALKDKGVDQDLFSFAFGTLEVK